ncbi:hypothetical protein [Sphingomonas adhaesiva]|uniref:hypothetical protein n=1 Tax=Sphingomonas adhaesiva TaxID=28212 RepID=UPI002FF7E67A
MLRARGQYGIDDRQIGRVGHQLAMLIRHRQRHVDRGPHPVRAIERPPHDRCRARDDAGAHRIADIAHDRVVKLVHRHRHRRVAADVGGDADAMCVADAQPGGDQRRDVAADRFERATQRHGGGVDRHRAVGLARRQMDVEEQSEDHRAVEVAGEQSSHHDVEIGMQLRQQSRRDGHLVRRWIRHVGHPIGKHVKR